MTLRIGKMKKFWILAAILTTAMLLLVPAIAFAESDDGGSDSDTTESSSGSTEFSVSDSSGTEGSSDSGDTTTVLPSTNEGDSDSDTTESSSNSTEFTVSGSNGSTTELSSTDDGATEGSTIPDEDAPPTLENTSTETSGGGGNSYTAEITPDSGLGLNEPTDFTVTFTEVGDTTLLGSAQLIIPDGFTDINLDPTITTSGGEIWFGNLVGQVLSLWADTAGDYLGEGGWVSAEFTATTPSTPGDYIFQTSAWTDSAGYLFVDNWTPDTVDLGTAKSFAILAGSTITNTGPTTVDGTAGGNIGLHPGEDPYPLTFPGQEDVTYSGDVHLYDAVAEQAKADLVIAYNDAAGRPSNATITDNLAGQTLTAGVYSSGSSIDLAVGGVLTLDGQNNPNSVFIFQAGSTLTIGNDSIVRLINGAQPCRVFWQVGSSATLGTDSVFVGHILALTSITANTRAEVTGQLLARNGAVTLDTNEIHNDLCENYTNSPDASYNDTETLVVTVGNGTGTGSVDGATPLGSDTVEDSDTLSGDKLALPATGGLPLVQVLFALGGVMMTVGGIVLKRKIN